MVTLLPWPMKIRTSSSLTGGRPWSASTLLTATCMSRALSIRVPSRS
jgi:hypothetical protein